MKCLDCGTENREGRRFCSECGASLALSCAVCGAANDPADKFCGQCGAALDGSVAPAAVSMPGGPRAQPAAERRLVSILFADLVGFTTLSESRDAEEVRELLSRYFDESRRLVARYGGIVEKFIGDAVMALWGAPVAQEDDAERAVRAALDLAAAVDALGAEIGADLHARVGVLTGEAAVTVGAEGQGMVAGDLVNTASRIQSEAEPGTVLVGEVTRRASEDAIAYEDVGPRHLKGKEEPVPLWRAVRVVGGSKGRMRATGLEPPFVGRDREMRMIKQLYHGVADDGTAHLVSVLGVAGVGKTRLSWELEKYIDGLAMEYWWHRGRCLAYGEGVAYWALAEMVRGRAGIVEAEDPSSAGPKLRAVVEEHVPDPEERAYVEPRLAHLLGLEDRTARDQADLFSAWRLFFERMARTDPVVMVFEDLQWADGALLDFIEYLMEWSRDHPLFIVTLARPELDERRPTWGAGRGSSTSISLEPLPPLAMEELLRGLVPGLPDDARRAILDRAEGIPLYAVETVRMLIDRGLLERSNGEYRPTGPIEDLEVPESLQGLIAARLDGLTPEERSLVQDASVLGKVFTKPFLAAMSGLPEDRLEPLLTSLVRKELLSVQADPRSPERGQYGFLQDLMRKVAYDTLSKRERKTRHLAASDYLRESWGGDEEEIVEVTAAHLLEAYRVAPDAPDAAEIKERAGRSLIQAGERAASLAANEEAQGNFERAAELTDDPVRRAELLERAGQMAWAGGRGEETRTHYRGAIELFEAEGATHPAARVAARLGEITWAEGHIDQAVEEMERSFEILSADEPDEDLASLAAQLGRFHYFMGHVDLAAERLEQALGMAESLWLPEVLSMALNSKGGLVIDFARGRPEEGQALVRHALNVALENDAPAAALRAYYNLSNAHYYFDRWPKALDLAQAGLELARKRGDRSWEWGMLAMICGTQYLSGDWDAALETATEIPDLENLATRAAAAELLLILPAIHVSRGNLGEAGRVFDLFTAFGETADVQERACYRAAEAMLLRARGDDERALAAARETIEHRDVLGPSHASVKLAVIEGGEAAFALGETAVVEELVAIIRDLGVGRSTPLLQALAARFLARLGARDGESMDVAGRFEEAESLVRGADLPFWLATTLVEHAEWAISRGRADDTKPLLAEAREVFERLGAKPWIERVDRARA